MLLAKASREKLVAASKSHSKGLSCASSSSSDDEIGLDTLAEKADWIALADAREALDASDDVRFTDFRVIVRGGAGAANCHTG